MAGKGGAPRAPSFRGVNLDFWLEGGGKGGGRGGRGLGKFEFFDLKKILEKNLTKI